TERRAAHSERRSQSRVRAPQGSDAAVARRGHGAAALQDVEDENESGLPGVDVQRQGVTTLAVSTYQVADFSERAPKVALHIFLVALARRQDSIRQPRERQRLEPDAAGAGHRRQEEPFTPEQRGLDAADELDVVI